MTTQLEKLKKWSEETGIKLENFYSIEFFAEDIKLYAHFNQDLSCDMYNLDFKFSVIATGSVKYTLNNITIYLS